MNVTPTASPVRSRVIHLADTQASIPGPAGEHAVKLLQRGALDVALSIPKRPIPQSPHEQDELYLIIRGRGILFHDGKREPGKGLFVGGVKLPLALAELGLIDEYEFVVHPRVAGHGPTLFAGLSKHLDLKLVSRLEFGSGAVAMRYEPRR